jgi:C-3',4' desaturase CrtD
LSKVYDHIIIGAGFGGLSAGLLLQQKGANVLILESHTVSGGCASYYRRISKENPTGNFNFDVGATTLSGLRSDQPLYKFINEAGIADEVKQNVFKQDIGVTAHMGNKKIFRYADAGLWIKECLEKFGGGEDMKKFWELIIRLEKKSYALIPNLKNFPPVKLTDYFSLPKNPFNLNLLYYLTQTVDDILRKFNLYENTAFRNFLNEQLMITAQALADKVPFLPAALALNYPSETYYVKGGMYSFAKIIEDKFKSLGGKILFKNRVERIEKNKNEFIVFTNKGEYRANEIISNAPIWDNDKLFTNEEYKKYFRKLSDKNSDAWGAFTLYFGVEDKFDDLNSLYHQIHFKSSLTNSKSIFVSISKKEDVLKAPHGWRTITISTHLENADEWKNYSEEIYEEKKRILTEEVFEALNNNLQGFPECNKKFVLSGSPKTFEFYTKRKNGFVGGIPATISRNFFRQIPSKTPIEGYYLVGDTVFPGQGAPAVILGSMLLVESL